MKTIGIITDSHSGISQKDAEDLGILVLPMPFYCEEECFYEGVSIDRELFFEKLRGGQTVSTSQPSPAEVIDIWLKGLEKFDELLYIPLSSGLSGACGTAMMLAQEDVFEDKVFVVDNGRISVPLRRSILDAVELAKEELSASEIKDILEKSKNDMSIYLGVETLEYLKKGGRITPATAAIGSALNIKPILRVDTGKLDTYKKCRGMKKVKKELLDAMKHDLATTFKEQYEAGEITLMAASSADEETAMAWVEEIKKNFPGMDVMYDHLSMGISCHTGEGALGIGCSCKPRK